MAKRERTSRTDSKGGRAGWKGSLKFSLISIPIRVLPATQSSDVAFHQLHRRCKTRIQMKKWCPHCEEEVSQDDIVKGYEKSKGRFVVAEESDIEEVRPESTKTVDISHVLTDSRIDPIFIERSYYVVPETSAAGSSFAVVREGLGEKAAIGRLAIYGREYLVAIVAREDAMMMFTLRTAGEVRDAASLDGLEYARHRTSPAEVKLARQVLGSFPSKEDLSDFTDNYQKALREMLEAKTDEGEIVTTGEDKGTGRDKSNVVPLMEALRRSLESAKAGGSRKATKSAAKSKSKKARVLKHSGGSRRARKAS